MNPRLILLVLLMCLSLGEASAQYLIQLKLDKTTFLSQEPIQATVSIANHSGADVVMGGRSNSNWLQFHLEDSNGRQFTPISVEVEEPFIFKAGASMRRQVLITDTHAVSEIGNYGVTAVVYHAPSQNYYQSNRTRFGVTEVSAYWQQDFGVPQGFPEAGRVRRYSLHLLRDDNGTKLYFRLTDERSQQRMATYSLGPISLALDPTFSLDSKNQLQVFFLAAPQTFAHCVLDPEGNLVTRQYYREVEKSRPALATRNGEFFVNGGTPYNPNAPPPEAADGARRASERPPGL